MRKSRFKTKKNRRKADALGLLGIARRAGALTIGVDATRRGLQNGLVRLVVVAADASPTQISKLERLVDRAGVQVRVASERETLGRALGVSSISAVGVTSKSFASQLVQAFAPRTPDSPDGESSREAQEERRSDAGR